MWKKICREVKRIIYLASSLIFFLTPTIGRIAYAVTFTDSETGGGSNVYDKYPLSNYDLDFYIDTSWNWLPWNWLSGIGDTVMYGLYAITNVIWSFSVWISSMTGYIVQQAMSFDLIDDIANELGTNIQLIAGVNSDGSLKSGGLFLGFSILILVILGGYIIIVGLLKRQTSKALGQVLTTIMIFVFSAGFIVNAPAYITKVNDFSRDLQSAAMTVCLNVISPNSSSTDGASAVRDGLFSVQVVEPWKILQFGSTDVDDSRVNAILEEEHGSEERDEAVQEDIETYDNMNMTTPEVMSRFGKVILILVLNIGISVFVIYLCVMSFFTQILFIVFAMFLPVSLVVAMIPSQGNLVRRAVVNLFNLLLARAGITLVIGISFSLSLMMYSLGDSYPFFFVMILQAIIFATVSMQLHKILSMFSIQEEGQGMGGRMFGRLRRSGRSIRHAFSTAAGVAIGKRLGNRKKNKNDNVPQNKAQKGGTGGGDSGSESSSSNSEGENNANQTNESGEKKTSYEGTEKNNFSSRVGRKIANVSTAHRRAADKIDEAVYKVRNAPDSVKEKAKQAKEDFKQNFSGQRKATKEKIEERDKKRMAGYDRKEKVKASTHSTENLIKNRNKGASAIYEPKESNERRVKVNAASTSGRVSGRKPSSAQNTSESNSGSGRTYKVGAPRSVSAHRSGSQSSASTASDSSAGQSEGSSSGRTVKANRPTHTVKRR